MRVKKQMTRYFTYLFCVSWCFSTGSAFAQCYPGLGDCATSPAPPASQAPPAQSNAPPPATLNNSGRSLWTHNGSLVYLTAEGDTRRFYYKQPREGMRAVGARPGTILFEGRRDGTSYAGTAYIFTTQCGAIPYQVRGVVSHDERQVTLRGAAPSQVEGGCRVLGYRDDVLVFDFVRSE